MSAAINPVMSGEMRLMWTPYPDWAPSLARPRDDWQIRRPADTSVTGRRAV